MFDKYFSFLFNAVFRNKWLVLALAAAVGYHRPVQGAKFLSAQLMAVLVDMAEHVVEALNSEHVVGAPAGDPLGRFAPVGDVAAQIADVDAVAERVDDRCHVEIGEVFHGWIPVVITPNGSWVSVCCVCDLTPGNNPWPP